MLGELSALYESNGDPGCISDGYGDPGGKSYGTYQLSSNAGSLQAYIEWLQDNGYWFGKELNQYELTSAEFDAAWEWLAESGNRGDFAKSQHNYIEDRYYKRAVAVLDALNWHVEKHDDVMKDVIWSRSVQYGPDEIGNMFTEACQSLGYPNLSYVDAAYFDADMIRAIYLNVCSSWEWNHSSLRENLNQRFQDECYEALQRLQEVTPDVTKGGEKKMGSIYFSDDELTCHCCGKYPENGMSQSLLDLLDEIRERVGGPVELSCAYRCPNHNADVGGVTNSQHVLGTAADVLVPDGWSVDKLADLAVELGADGVGRYYSNDFVHVDVRDGRVGSGYAWNG